MCSSDCVNICFEKMSTVY